MIEQTFSSVFGSNQYTAQFFTVAFIHLLAVASPGPDFAVVVRQSIGYGRVTAIQTSIGVGCAILIHVFYSLLGIGVIISQSVTAFTVMKFIGAIYLFYIGFRAIRTKPLNLSFNEKEQCTLPSASKAFLTGFFTNGLNPKATLFFLSLFTVVIDHSTPIKIQAFYGLYMALATMVWFTFISLIFGHEKVRKLFRKAGHWFERVMGLTLMVLAVKLAFSHR